MIIKPNRKRILQETRILIEDISYNDKSFNAKNSGAVGFNYRSSDQHRINNKFSKEKIYTGIKRCISGMAGVGVE